jgi:hypothetical protein
MPAPRLAMGEHGPVSNEPDAAGLVRALEELSGTNTEEQVFVVPTDPSQPWHLDVVELEEEDGPRFAVYAEYGGDAAFEERGLPLPEGSYIDADEGSNVTITFGELTSGDAAALLARWADVLSNSTGFTWSTTWD